MVILIARPAVQHKAMSIATIAVPGRWMVGVRIRRSVQQRQRRTRSERTSFLDFFRQERKNMAIKITITVSAQEIINLASRKLEDAFNHPFDVKIPTSVVISDPSSESCISLEKGDSESVSVHFFKP